MTDPIRAVRALVDSGQLEPPAGEPSSMGWRLPLLLELGRQDLSVGRVAEAHIDGTSILREAGHRPRSEPLHGVWTSDRPTAGLHARRTSSGVVLEGARQFCTAAGACDIALVTALLDERPVLVRVDVERGRADGTITVDTSSWATRAFAGTGIGLVELRQLELDADDLIGPPGWYTERPGFWVGALGPAALWAGAAIALCDRAGATSRRDPHTLAQLGALDALSWQLHVLVDRAAREADAAPPDHTAARRRAIVVRHLVAAASREVIERFGKVLGPAPAAFEPEVSRRLEELGLSILQHHSDRDLELIAGADPT